MTDSGRSNPSAVGIVIVGAGGFGREVYQYALDTYLHNELISVKGFLDDDDNLKDLSAFGLHVDVLGDTETYDVLGSDRFVIAVGEPTIRARLAARLASRGASFISIVHPLAFVASSARVGAGCIIAPFATLGAHAVVGDHSVLTFYASVGHDGTVGDACALSPHAVANGGSTIGDETFLGTHAVVNPKIVVGSRVRVAAGSVVYRHIADGQLVVGNPAKQRPRW